jgi:hypothetical protein
MIVFSRPAVDQQMRYPGSLAILGWQSLLQQLATRREMREHVKIRLF